MIDNIAGIYELIIGTFGFILYSVAEHNFVLRAIKSLFLINTTDPDLIKECFHEHGLTSEKFQK